MVRHRILGAPVDALSFANTLAQVEALIGQDGVHHIAGLNAAKIVDYINGDEFFRQAIDESAIVSADGISLVWAARLFGVRLPGRVAGIDLMLSLLPSLAKRQTPTFVLGATPAVLDALLASPPFRSINVVGSRHGYGLDGDVLDGVIRDVVEAGAQVLFVGMTSPMKELVYLRVREHADALIVMGVGGSFDVISGKVKRAPAWVQRLGFEWVVRLAQEPRRLARRYLIGNASFLWITLRHAFRRGK